MNSVNVTHRLARGHSRQTLRRIARVNCCPDACRSIAVPWQLLIRYRIEDYSCNLHRCVWRGLSEIDYLPRLTSISIQPTVFMRSTVANRNCVQLDTNCHGAASSHLQENGLLWCLAVGCDTIT